MQRVAKRETKGRPYVCLIEDDPDIRRMIEDILGTEGYRVVSAANGQEALAHLREEQPGVILLDLVMPVMDGWEFRDRIERDPSLASIPVVVLSGDGGVAEKAASIGAVAYLKKPVELGALLETVERYC